MKHKMVGDVNADIQIIVHPENIVKGYSFSLCGFDGMLDGTRDRDPEMIERTKEHELKHCQVFTAVLASLKDTIMNSPLRDTPEECEADVVRFTRMAADLWACTNVREVNHCSHVGEVYYEIDDCGREYVGGVLPAGYCPNCN
jgi:hypothetical protein